MSQNSILRIVVLRKRGFLRKMYVHFYNSDRKKATCSFTVCKLLNFTFSNFLREILSYRKIFRQINYLVNSLVKRCFHEIFAKEV